jgi:cell division protease FtsH
LLAEHRQGLAEVAKALLDKETVNGNEVGRLVDEAYGRPVHEEQQEVPEFADVQPTNGHDPEATPEEAPDVVPLPSSTWHHPRR